MLARQNASAFWDSSSVRASTSCCSFGQLANPYSRAIASWEPFKVSVGETTSIRWTASGSPSLAARKSSFAWRRSWSMFG
jgi:hypothetical protein